jgi:alpha-D-xyloside xylohydrolase
MAVTRNGSTMMRPMIMDFREDTAAVKQPFEYLFGRALLIAPITEPGVNEWNVYLPKSTIWYDFWTGKHYIGGQNIKTEAPLDKIPVFVKAGSIIPIGPVVQYAGEKKWDCLEIRIYEGSNGVFALYEDEGDNYNYEKGVYSTIDFSWDDAKKTLTIGNRKGSFPEMPAERKFSFLCVSPKSTTCMEAVEKYDKEVTYTGSQLVINF